MKVWLTFLVQLVNKITSLILVQLVHSYKLLLNIFILRTRMHLLRFYEKIYFQNELKLEQL